jgi:hypothetical protein
MSNHVIEAIAVLLTLVTAGVSAAISVSAYPQGPARGYPNGPARGAILEAPMATSGNNVFMAWTNNDTGHFNVFFGKSTDGRKTLKIMMISAPSKGHNIDQNTEISATGSNVYVTW